MNYDNPDRVQVNLKKLRKLIEDVSSASYPVDKLMVLYKRPIKFSPMNLANVLLDVEDFEPRGQLCTLSPQAIEAFAKIRKTVFTELKQMLHDGNAWVDQNIHRWTHDTAAFIHIPLVVGKRSIELTQPDNAYRLNDVSIVKSPRGGYIINNESNGVYTIHARDFKVHILVLSDRVDVVVTGEDQVNELVIKLIYDCIPMFGH